MKQLGWIMLGLIICGFFLFYNKLGESNGGGDGYPHVAPAVSRIYVDSVPSGADVYLLPADENSAAKQALLGKTPLIVEAAQCPGLRFLVSMKMDYYLGQIEKIPEMHDWIKEFRSEQNFSSQTMSQNYFDFDVPDSRITTTINGGLVSVGPVYNLEGLSQNRICVCFIPKGKKVSLFYPLMPPQGTFERLKGHWHEVLLEEYHFSEAQAEEALDCMSRCGKYTTQVKDPFKSGFAREYDLTIDGGSKIRVSIHSYEVRLIRGFND